MPNWCENRLVIERMPDELKAYFRNNGLSFAKINPPKIQGDGGDYMVPGQIESHWDAWSVKWDLDESDQKECGDALAADGEARFDTAWSPPFNAMVALSEQFPGVPMHLHYYEGGMGFYGTASICDGQLHDNDMSEAPAEIMADFLENCMLMDNDTARYYAGLISDEEYHGLTETPTEENNEQQQQ